MSYVFNPMTDEELNAINLVDEGVYNFEVIKSTKKISKSNNSMAELQLKIWDHNGVVHVVFDWLVFSNVPLNIRKVKHFCESTGLHEQYKKGQIPEELERLKGKVNIGIQDEQPNPNGGFYPKKNSVIDYVVVDSENKLKSEIKEDFQDSDIPF